MKFDKNDIIVRCMADNFLPLALMYGVAVILHGNLTPGGGFQGGTICATAVLLMYLGHGFKITKNSLNPHAMHVNEALGSTTYVILAVLGIIFGFNFCANVLYQSGAIGELWSGGTIALMNYAVGWKVFAGISLLIMMMVSLLGVDSIDPDERVDIINAEEAAEPNLDKGVDVQ